MKLITTGIDAGSSRAGIVTLEYNEGYRFKLLNAHHVRLDKEPYKDRDFQQRMAALYRITVRDLKKWKPDVVVVEHIRFAGGGRNLDGYLKSARSQQTAELAVLEALGSLPFEMLASQIRARLRIKGKKRDDAKAEVMAMVNKTFEADLREMGLYPLSGDQDDLSDAAAMALIGPALWKKAAE